MTGRSVTSWTALAATQFVAVLGGSGSGKSSLVIAGVVPRLRSYGIPGAGDLWLPLVCTPGTDADGSQQAEAGAAPQAGPPTRRDATPLVRLAHAFAMLLQSRGSAQADAEREANTKSSCCGKSRAWRGCWTPTRPN